MKYMSEHEDRSAQVDEFVRYHQKSFPDPAQPKTSSGLAPTRTKPVRLSVDLPLDLYKPLTQLSHDLADQIGVARVPHVGIIRALVSRVLNDPQLQAQILNDLHNPTL